MTNLNKKLLNFLNSFVYYLKGYCLFSYLNIKPEMHYVAIFYNIFFSFYLKFPCFFAFGFGTIMNKIFIPNHFGTNKTSFKISMNYSRNYLYVVQKRKLAVQKKHKNKQKIINSQQITLVFCENFSWIFFKIYEKAFAWLPKFGKFIKK